MRGRKRPASASLTYRPLNHHDAIRLVVLHPGQCKEPIIISLIEVTLSNAPSYEALSYVWSQTPGWSRILSFTPKPTLQDGGGDNDSIDASQAGLIRTGRNRITCGVKSGLVSAKVTKNLLHALRNLRRLRVKQILWIDQLCINQKCLTERTQQVHLMRKIYQEASQTIVWLGLSANSSDDALDLIDCLARKLPKINASELDVDLLERVSLPAISDDKWHSIGHLFQRPWFNRVWTVQEVAVSRSTIVLCGMKMLPWRTLAKCVDAMWKHQHLLLMVLGKLSLKEVQSLNWAPAQVTAIEHVRRGGYVDKTNGTFPEMLSAFVNCEASDCRDKLFSLQGLLPRWESNIMPLPDYSMTAREVFVQFAVSYLEHFSSLEILSSAGIARQSFDLPSWVPDWSSKVKTSGFFRSAKYSIAKMANVEPGSPRSIIDKGPMRVVPLYDIMGNKFSTTRFTTDRQGLIVQGTLLSRIDILGAEFPETPTRPGFSSPDYNREHWYMSLQSSWDCCFELTTRHCVPQRYLSVKEAQSACQLCLTGGRSRDLKRASEEATTRKFSTLMKLRSQTLRQYNQTSLPSKSSGQKIGDTDDRAKYEVKQWEKHEAYELILNLQTITSGRTFFVSDDKRIGLAPQRILVGDYICALRGLSVPYVIRKAAIKGRQGFLLVGECYVQGVMSGEFSNVLSASCEEILLI